MNTTDLGVYVRKLLQDPDSFFLSDAYLASMLALAYEQFRDMAPDEYFEVSYTPATLTGVFALDLTAILFPTQAVPVLPGGVLPAKRFTRVMQIDPSTGQLLNLFEASPSYEQLGVVAGYGYTPGNSTANQFLAGRWYLDGNVLRFNRPVSGTVQIWYSPQSLIYWTSAIAPNANLFIDNLSQFHDIIALLAARQYAMPNGQLSPAIMTNLQMRKNEMISYFSRSRSGKASKYIQ